jgi:hypothetical protein
MMRMTAEESKVVDNILLEHRGKRLEFKQDAVHPLGPQLSKEMTFSPHIQFLGIKGDWGWGWGGVGDKTLGTVLPILHRLGP